MGANVRTLQAAVVAAQMAGALMMVFQRTLQYANELQQLGGLSAGSNPDSTGCR